MNQIKIITYCHGRESVLQVFVNNLLALVPVPKVIICGSGEDNCKSIVEAAGFEYIEYKNFPVGEKANFCCSHAFEFDVTHYMITGSDDLISQRLWDFYLNYKGSYCGLKDLYFFCTESRKLIYWKGYLEEKRYFGYPIGSCLLISRDLMEEVDFKPYKNESKWPREQDAHESIREFQDIELFGVNEVGISVDLKGGGITRFDLWPNSEYCGLEELKVDMDIYNIVTQI